MRSPFLKSIQVLRVSTKCGSLSGLILASSPWFFDFRLNLRHRCREKIATAASCTNESLAHEWMCVFMYEWDEWMYVCMYVCVCDKIRKAQIATTRLCFGSSMSVKKRGEWDRIRSENVIKMNLFKKKFKVLLFRLALNRIRELRTSQTISLSGNN